MELVIPEFVRSVQDLGTSVKWLAFACVFCALVALFLGVRER